MVQEFARTLNFDPGLPKTGLFVTHVLNFDVSLLIRIIAAEKQIADIFAVNLQGTNLNEYLLVEVALVPVCFMLNKQGNSWKNA